MLYILDRFYTCCNFKNGAMHTILNAFEEEDADAAKEGLNRSVIKDLDIDFSRSALENTYLNKFAKKSKFLSKQFCNQTK